MQRVLNKAGARYVSLPDAQFIDVELLGSMRSHPPPPTLPPHPLRLLLPPLQSSVLLLHAWVGDNTAMRL